MQSDLIIKLARGMRLCFHELCKDMPDIERAKDLLDENYIGGRGEIQRSLKTRTRKGH